MDLQIAALLAQDGITSGAIYALLGVALVLVFAVTRIIFIPQGEFVAFGALTLVTLQAGQIPGTVGLLCALALLVFLLDLPAALRGGSAVSLRSSLLSNLAYPLLLLIACYLLPLAQMPLLLQILLTLAILVPMGPQLYRIVYQPLADTSVLVLLIASIALHVALIGLGLVFFGAEGGRTDSFSDAAFSLGPMLITGQQLWVVGSSIALIVALYLFFDRSLYGKALRATAINRNGARLMGFSPVFAGKLTLLLAALIGVLSGVLIAPVTTIYYDTGFLIGLKGFVAAILGGLVSYPLAAAGALLVGLLESFSSFWASAYKEVLVFTLIVPVLVWRSLRSHGVEEED